jgi:SAM-dependent methyltransferase
MKKSCPYCDRDSDLYFRSRDYNRSITNEIFDHYRCPNCRLIFISPIPTNLGDYYPRSYYSIARTIEGLESESAFDQYKVEIVQRFAPPGRLLEIGPGCGGFAYRAKKAGFETEAIEMDARCSAFLNDVVGVPTVHSSDTPIALKTLGSFDVVALWHVIEHLSDLWSTLDAIVEKIKPRGLLVLAAPNPGAFQFKILRRYWPHVDAPRHVMLIPPQLLIDKMNRIGMKLELMTTADPGGRTWNVFGWEYFFSHFWRHGRTNKILKKFGRGLAKLLRPIECSEGRGCAYTMVFRKDVK